MGRHGGKNKKPTYKRSPLKGHARQREIPDADSSPVRDRKPEYLAARKQGKEEEEKSDKPEVKTVDPTGQVDVMETGNAVADPAKNDQEEEEKGGLSEADHAVRTGNGVFSVSGSSEDENGVGSHDNAASVVVGDNKEVVDGQVESLDQDEDDNLVRERKQKTLISLIYLS